MMDSAMHMKSIFFALATFLLSAHLAQAASQQKGMGLIIGEPTGFSGKIWLKEKFAVDAAAGWSVGKNGATYLHIDSLWHNRDFFQVSRGAMLLYYGVGGRFLVKNSSVFGVRIPIGLSYEFDRAPIDVFVEAAPIMNLVPSTTLDLSLAFGIRYFF